MRSPLGGASIEKAAPRLPPPAAVAVGLLAALLGVLLTVSPFRSMAVLVILVVGGLLAAGVVDLVAPSRSRDRRLARLRGLLQVAAAVALLVWPGPGLRVITQLVAIALVVDGITDLVSATRSAGRERWGSLGFGLASALIGALALAWPDVAVLAVAIAFGVRLVLAGLRLATAGLRSRGAGRLIAVDPPRATAGRWHLFRGITAGIASLLLVALSLLVQLGAPTADAFYAAPESVPATPGQLIRSEPFDRDVPAGARGWRILYTTTRDDGVPAVASAIVVTPRGARSATPVIAWAHGTTGWATGCAPSLLEHPFEAGALFSVGEVVDEGWTLVATDYVGLGTEGSHPYLIGQGEARSVLDSVRAARQLDDVSISDSTVVWGHSQGGHAALWTGMLAPTYAPELQIGGVAAMAPAANLVALVDVVGSIRVGSLFGAYVVQAYTDAYADVPYDDYVRPGAQVIVREMAARCLAERGVLVSAATALLLDRPVWDLEPTTGAFGARLAENIPTGRIPAPLLIGQGKADTLIAPATQQAFVADRCAAGQAVDYRTYDGRDHVGLMHADSPAVTELFDWTRQRFSGAPPSSTCPSPRPVGAGG